MNPQEKFLFIHPRKGLFRVTKCNSCGHTWQCDQCDANLVTYRSTEFSFQMVCHQCQSHHHYPKKCPECGNTDITSAVGGADELAEQLKNKFGVEPLRYDEIKSNAKKSIGSDTVAISTRIFDPLIPYSEYNQIIFIHAENLFASPDYQVQEESMRQIAQLLHELSPETQVFFDTKVPQDSFYGVIQQINDPDNSNTSWFTDFLDTEGKNRLQFQFPPFHNVLLFTTQEKSKENSYQTIDAVHRELERISDQLPNTNTTSPYEAKFLKRKGMYSYHSILRYPRGYKHFPALRKAINELSDRFNIQIRLNPRHLF